jgi:cellulose synthase/poly-beta-1,6-N-acetylglucosamine synthase-like glycosyltransferase
VAENFPIVTVIIPTRPGDSDVNALAAARNLDYPKDKLEILVVRGKQPSVQRNNAIKAARGEIIYFLDDDSIPLNENLKRALKHFARSEVKMVGGPNLCPPDAPSLEQNFALTMGSWLAFGPSRARYKSIGSTRESGEKELILCNLIARRADLIELGGFDESLYPNEENALMDELQKRGGKLIYDPNFIVHRRPRATLKAFIKMLMNYGRGRAEQFRLHPTPGSAMNFVPPLFVLYLLAVPFLPWIFDLPLLIYGTAVVVQASLILPRRKWVWLPIQVALIFLSHVFYGLGFWRGLFTRPKPPTEKLSGEVVLEKVSG